MSLHCILDLLFVFIKSFPSVHLVSGLYALISYMLHFFHHRLVFCMLVSSTYVYLVVHSITITFADLLVIPLVQFQFESLCFMCFFFFYQLFFCFGTKTIPQGYLSPVKAKKDHFFSHIFYFIISVTIL